MNEITVCLLNVTLFYYCSPHLIPPSLCVFFFCSFKVRMESHMQFGGKFELRGATIVDSSLAGLDALGVTWLTGELYLTIYHLLNGNTFFLKKCCALCLMFHYFNASLKVCPANNSFCSNLRTVVLTLLSYCAPFLLSARCRSLLSRVPDP